MAWRYLKDLGLAPSTGSVENVYSKMDWYLRLLECEQMLSR
jgi:hypothetical protein